MLQEASKVLSSAFKDSIIKKLSMYLHDCVAEEVRSSSFRNLNQDKGNKWFFIDGKEILFSNPDKPLKIKNADSKLTELMVQSEVSKKDYQLIYTYLYLKGKSTENRKKENYLTPLFYVPCRLEREGLDINCILLDDNISLNTSALVSLMNFDDDDETADHLFEGLIDYIPELPLNDEKVKIFLNTLKAIVPEIEIVSELPAEELIAQPLENLTVVDVAAVVLTKRPTVSAGLLHELSQISEKPAGVFRETALIPIHEEFSGATKNKKASKNQEKEEKSTIMPLAFSDSQKQVVEAIKNNTLITVFGPPGTGKSQTIVNLVSHLVGSGQTVLVASRMDKAVDVVSDRLNSFGAHFLCLRAGKSDYQKQLSFKLQDLISNKVDLDADFESSVLTDVEDLETLAKNKNELKQKCIKILDHENKWYEVLQEYRKVLETQGDNKLINKTLSKPEIEQCRKMLDKIEKTFDKTGMFNWVNFKISAFLLNRLTGVYIGRPHCHAELDSASIQNAENCIKPQKGKTLKQVQGDNMENGNDVVRYLRINMLEKELKENLKGIENKINKTGNLHQLLENLNEIREKNKLTAVKILKNRRRDALKSLIRDQYKRQRLIVHSKALVERKKSLQNKVLLNEDFQPMLQAFPCWAVTTQAVSESLPLEPGLFDVAIIDESSQCDIASCFPILFRAKKAIIVGDDRQLPHLSFLEKAKEQSFLSKYNIPDRYHLMWRFRTNSMFDMTNYYSTATILLDEHFRSYPEIINFSNREFYGNRIKSMKRRVLSEENECPLELNIVENAKVDLDSTRNMAEVEKIMERVHDIIINSEKDNSKKPVSIGIISPFRGQVDLIKKAVSQVLTGEIVRKHDIEVGTAHTFQGDERDIMLLSLTLAPNSHFQSIMFAQKPNLFNVAITRARKKLVCYISRPVESLPSGLIRNYLEYIQELNRKKQFSGYEFSCPVREEIAKLIEDEGIKVFPDFETAGLKVDFAVSDGINSIILELDGFGNENAENLAKSVEKQDILERCGWKVVRISSREWHYSKKACINKVKNILASIIGGC